MNKQVFIIVNITLAIKNSTIHMVTTTEDDTKPAFEGLAIHSKHTTIKR